MSIFLRQATENQPVNQIESENSFTKEDMIEPVVNVIDRLTKSVRVLCDESIERCINTTRPFSFIDPEIFNMHTDLMDDIFFDRFKTEIEHDIHGNIFSVYDTATMLNLLSVSDDGSPNMRNCKSWEDIANYICIYRDRAIFVLSLMRERVLNRNFDHVFYTTKIMLEEDTPVLADKIKMMTGLM